MGLGGRESLEDASVGRGAKVLQEKALMGSRQRKRKREGAPGTGNYT